MYECSCFLRLTILMQVQFSILILTIAICLVHVQLYHFWMLDNPSSKYRP